MFSIRAFHSVETVVGLLRITFGLVAIVAGADKFTNILTNWEADLNPDIAGMLPFTPHIFMKIVGIVEIAAGLLVLARPAIGGHIIAIWLLLIAITLVAGGKYYDIAVRDTVMAISAFSLAKLAAIVDEDEDEDEETENTINAN